jgi:hypothetical protein
MLEPCDKVANASAGYGCGRDVVTVMSLELRTTTTSSELVGMTGDASVLSSAAKTYKSAQLEFVAAIGDASVDTEL